MRETRRFVEVVFPLPLHQTFTYSLPGEFEFAPIGSRILAPFGPRTLTGYVVSHTPQVGEMTIKNVDAILDDEPILTHELIALARKMAALYGASLGQAITTVLPPGLSRHTRRKVLPSERTDPPLDFEFAKLWERIQKSSGLDFVTLVRRNPGIHRMIRELEKGGWVKVQSVLKPERARNSKKVKSHNVSESLRQAPFVVLNPEQMEVCSKLKEAFNQKEFFSFLLHGVTGSGKTEVYLQMASESLSRGKTVLALVPEIALTPQFVGRFQARFENQVSVLHSGRSEAERLFEWKKIRRGESKIVIGARSAVFAPLQNVGLVIVDEEHDTSYKQEEGLLYNARELARFRAEQEKAVFLLGSATPSLESYWSSTMPKHSLLTLPFRAGGQKLPDVDIVDLRKLSDPPGRKTTFSEELLSAISDALSKGEQIVLFLNRRGYAPSVLCPTCGVNLRCDQCSVSLTLHERDGIVLCHYCGHSRSFRVPCPACGQTMLVPLGVGTERVEKELNFYFPDAKVLRMDRDSVRKKGEHERILSDLVKGKADILIGTQMVTKGIDLPNVTLVGVLLADQSLHIPDFRSAERTFQLLTQVVGRSGRAEKEGRAIVQTFRPEHYAIQAAALQDFTLFYNQELPHRKEANYPPFSSLSLVEIIGSDRSMAQKGAMWLGIQARKHMPKDIDFMGPAPAPVEKIEGKSRFHFIVRSSPGTASGDYAKWLVAQAREVLKPQTISLVLDIDPYQFV